MKSPLLSLVVAGSVFAGLAAPVSAGWKFSGVEAGGGYLEQLETGYFFGQLRGEVYEDAKFRHSVFAEFLYYGEDADVELTFLGGRRGIFDGDMDFVNLTLNYEAAVKLSPRFEAYFGAGAGVQIVSLDVDDYYYYDYTLDDDARFVGQVFAGVRADFGNGFGMRGGGAADLRGGFRDPRRRLQRGGPVGG